MSAADEASTMSTERCPGTWQPCPPTFEVVIVDDLPITRPIAAHCPVCDRKIHPRADGKIPTHKPRKRPR